MRTLTRRTRPARRGATLVELLVGATVGALLAALAARLLGVAGAHARRQTERRVARAQLAQGAAALRAELRAVSGDGHAGEGGDLLAARDTVLELRVVVGAGVACAGSAGARLELPATSRRDAPPFAWWGDAPEPGDVALVHDAGVAPDTLDDAWHARAVVSVEAGDCRTGPFAAVAEAGAARWRLVLASALPLTVGEGAPVRVLRRRRWSLYRGGDGSWALGLRAWDGAGYAPPQPVVGPLAAPADGGFVVQALDVHGHPVTDVRTARVETLAIQLVAGQGRSAAAWRDTVQLALRLRGGRPW